MVKTMGTMGARGLHEERYRASGKDCQNKDIKEQPVLDETESQSLYFLSSGEHKWPAWSIMCKNQMSLI